MIRKIYLSVLSLGAATLMLTAATASAQDIATCIADLDIDPSAEGLCLDDPDFSDPVDGIEESVLFDAVLQAEETCDGDAAPEACATCTVALDIDRSAGCSLCVVQLVACMQDECSADCGADLETHDSAECGTCAENACVATYDLCAFGPDAGGDDEVSEPGDDNDGGGSEGGGNEGDDSANGDGSNAGGETVDDPFGKTCSGGPDCKDGEWNVSQSGGRIGSSCSTGLGAGGGLAALLLGLGLVAQRRRQRA